MSSVPCRTSSFLPIREQRLDVRIRILLPVAHRISGVSRNPARIGTGIRRMGKGFDLERSIPISSASGSRTHFPSLLCCSGTLPNRLRYEFVDEHQWRLVWHVVTALRDDEEHVRTHFLNMVPTIQRTVIITPIPINRCASSHAQRQHENHARFVQIVHGFSPTIFLIASGMTRLYAAPSARARNCPQPPSTSCPAEWRSLASTPRTCRLRAISAARSQLGRRKPSPSVAL